MRGLPLDERGYPVPWFVAVLDGTPEFRAMDRNKWNLAVGERRCWVCGHPLGRWLVFVLGPICAINRTTAEPPCHQECAHWSARNCPFLSRPHARRRDSDMPEDVAPLGEPVKESAGVTLLWTSDSYEVFADAAGTDLIEIGPAQRVEWWAEGRAATRDEVAASIEAAVPTLRELVMRAGPQPGALEELQRQTDEVTRLYPPP